MRLDLGAGQKCKDGFEGVDLVQMPGVKHVVDLFRFPWPFDDKSVEEIHCSHLVEHTPDLIAFMDECHRILKPGAEIRITSPYYTSIRCWQDPTHVRAITDATFWYFDKRWREREQLDHYPIASDFEVVQVMHSILPQFVNMPQAKLQECMAHNWNVCEDITVILRKRPAV